MWMRLDLMAAQFLLGGRLVAAFGAAMQQQPQVLRQQVLPHSGLVRVPFIAHSTPKVATVALVPFSIVNIAAIPVGCEVLIVRGDDMLGICGIQVGRMVTQMIITCIR